MNELESGSIQSLKLNNANFRSVRVISISIKSLRSMVL